MDGHLFLRNKFLKIAVLTMTYKDYPALKRWVQHFGSLFGKSNLYVVSHGADKNHADIALGCNILSLPRDNMKRFDFVRATKLANIRRRIQSNYDIVFQVDADELLFFDSRYEFKRGDEAVFAIGMNVYPEGGRFSGHFSKAVATWGKNTLRRHGVQFQNEHCYVPEVARGLYLVHTKYFDVDELVATNAVRKEITNRFEDSVSALTWKNPTKMTLRKFAEFEDLPWGEWDEEADRLFKYIANNPRHIPDSRIVAAPHLESDKRVKLPTWISF